MDKALVEKTKKVIESVSMMESIRPCACRWHSFIFTDRKQIE